MVVSLSLRGVVVILTFVTTAIDEVMVLAGRWTSELVSILWGSGPEGQHDIRYACRGGKAPACMSIFYVRCSDRSALSDVGAQKKTLATSSEARELRGRVSSRQGEASQSKS